MKYYLGIDTSNYTTSAAVCDKSGKVIFNLKKMLPVPEGHKGLRQSDAVFAHIKNISEVLSGVKEIPISDIAAIGYSAYPRNIEGSYMPCFEVGAAVAGSIAHLADIPIYKFSHQQGHIRAVKYGCGQDDLNEFIAFHISGGTTDILYVNGDNIDRIGGTTDLNAGQAIDRCGVALGMKFPCGPELERLADKYDYDEPFNVSINGFECSLSGLENKFNKMIAEGEAPVKVASFTIRFISKTIDKLAGNVQSDVRYSSLPLIFAGGVMSCRYISDVISNKYNAYFAPPEFSSDNAAGTALLARDKDITINE